MTTAPEIETETETANEHYGVTDAQGETFDPELHAAKPNGEPALKTDGTFRKKRRDAGRRAAPPTSARTTTTAPPAGMPRALKEQHARHKKGLKDAGGVLLLVAGFVSPLDAYTLEPLADPMADALATVAQDNPQLAALFDKLGGAGSVTAAVAIAGLAVVQVLHNHDKIPENVARMVGAKPKTEALAQMGAHAEAIKAAAVQRAAQDAAEAAWMKEHADAA